MGQPLQGAINFDAVVSKEGFRQEPIEIQQYVADQYFIENIATKDGFKNEPADVQEFVKQKFFADYEIPAPQTMENVDPQVLPAMKPRPHAEAPQWEDYDPSKFKNSPWNPLTIYADANDALSSMTAGAIREVSFGYIDPTEMVRKNNQLMRQGGPRYVNSFAAEIGGSAVGGILSGEGLAGVAGHTVRGLGKSGRYLKPFSTPLAKAAGYPAGAANLGRRISTSLAKLGRTIGGNPISRLGAEGAAYGGLYKPEGGFFDGGERLVNAAIGGVIGAGLGKGMQSLGHHIPKLVDKIRYETPMGQMIEQGATRKMAQVFKGLVDLMDNEHLDDKSIKLVLKHAKSVRDGLKQKRMIRGMPKVTKDLSRLQNRAEFNRQLGRKYRQPEPIVHTPESVANTESLKATITKEQPAEVSPVFDETLVEYDYKKGSAEANVINDVQTQFEAIVTKVNRAQTIDEFGEVLKQLSADEMGVIDEAEYSRFFKFITEKEEQLNRKAAFEAKVRKEQGEAAGAYLEQRFNASLGGKSVDDARVLKGEVAALGRAEDDPIIKELTEQKKQTKDKTPERDAIEAKITKRKEERKALREAYSEIDDEAKDVLDTEFDLKTGIGVQKAIDPEKQLSFEDIENLLSEKEAAIASQYAEAMDDDVLVRNKYAAEISGRTGAAVSVTRSGGVTEAVTEFSPTHFGTVTKVIDNETGAVLGKNLKKTKEALEAGKASEKEFVQVHGYNSDGSFRGYYISEVPEGSHVAQVTKVTNTPAFRGTTPNLAKGSREYKVLDVLEAGKNAEEGILTSDASQVAKQLSGIFNPEFTKTLSKDVRSRISKINKRGRFDDGDIAALRKALQGDLEELQKFCNLFGLK